jgi:hypothetical protein
MSSSVDPRHKGSTIGRDCGVRLCGDKAVEIKVNVIAGASIRSAGDRLDGPG